MRLRRLVMRGFKSFADRTEFEFDANLTGIIGPNGCGKSNVVDGLKWVLGDQRARSLRGKEMTDVIFKGAEGRDGMTTAEVEVVLEDRSGRLDGRDEVRIGRRLSTDKESEYLLNGVPARLKDVRDFLLDTGLGVGAYSVMEQGRIDAVLSADPEERRAIFEEAAGISRFKLQKRETLRRLERTEINLARAKDLLEERGRRIRSLKIQAGKARRFLELRERLRDLRSALAVLEGRALRAVEAARRAELAAIEQELATADARRREAAAQAQELEARVAAARADVDACVEQIHRARATRDAETGRAQAAERRAAELDAEADETEAGLTRLAEQRREAEQQIATGRARLVQLEEQVIALQDQLAAAEQALRESGADVRKLLAEREAARTRALEGIHRRTKLRNLAHEQEAQIRATDGNRARAAARRGALAEELTRLQQEIVEVERQREALGRQDTEFAEQEQQILGELEQADRAAAELSRRESELRARHAAVHGKLQALTQMEAHLEGLDRGPRELLRAAPEGLLGRLIERLEIDVELGPALEAALGPLVQALVVDTRAHADAMLARLASAQNGRALLLVESEFGPELLSPRPFDLPDGCTPLASRVRCPDSARPLVQWLLRGVCLVDTLAGMPFERADLCFVTPAGELSCGPRREGGATAVAGPGSGGLIVRRAQITALRAQAAQLDAELAELHGGRELAAQAAEQLRQRVRGVGEQRRQAQAAHAAAGAELARRQGRTADLERERELLGRELAELGRQRTLALGRLGTHLLDLLVWGRLERAHEATEQALEMRLQQAQARQAELQRAEQEHRLQRAVLQGEHGSEQQAIAVREQTLVAMGRTQQELQQRSTTAREGAAAAREESSRRAQLAGEAEQALGAATEARTAAEAVQQERELARRQAGEAAATLEREREARSERRTQVLLMLGETEHAFARVEERLRSEVAVELRRCLGEVHGFGKLVDALEGPPAEDVELLEGPPLPPQIIEAELALRRLWEEPEFDSDAARAEAQVLQAQVDRLGAVNLDAVAELEGEEGNFVAVEEQVRDLTEARTGLIETLRRLETESRVLFEQTFEAARANFQEIFRKLFQGGRADMMLTGGEDLLESGIEIVARPPGKELQSINLLSGGERSLTALAILFAVFKVKPSPFCILDEVDAALDETNVERFLRVLRDFVGPTQFCIVTHHKRTMAACQVLYGITMQRRGVSSRIAVALHEVDELQAQPEPGAVALASRQRIAGEEQLGFE